MKKYIIILLVAASLAACNSTPKTQNTNEVVSDIKSDHKSTSAISFDILEHDFGKIAKNTQPECYFKFTNTGTEPLVLINVSASCGCTAIEFPKQAINPNTTDSIHVKFTGAKEVGSFAKTITVQSNASNGTQLLHIKGEQIN